MSAPLVSCMMPTRDRRADVARAVACWAAQTCPDSELLVLDNGADRVFDLLPADPRVKYRTLYPGKWELRDLRRFCVKWARGRYVMVWDNDDWHHPDRIAVALAATEGSGATLTALAPWELVEGPDGVIYLGDCGGDGQRVHDHTMMVRRDHWLAHLQPYGAPEQGDGFYPLMRSVPVAQWVTLTRPDLYLYRVHGANTSEVLWGCPRNLTAQRCRPLPGVTAADVMACRFTALDYFRLAGVADGL